MNPIDTATMITGMCSPESFPSFYDPGAEDRKKQAAQAKEFTTYFETLGYKVMDDWSTRTRQCWWEIYGEIGLICQIDKGVALKHVIEDLIAWHKGEESTSKIDYAICTEQGPEWNAFLKRVADNPEIVCREQLELFRK